MSTQPHALSQAEWNEIGDLETVQQDWGYTNRKDFLEYAADNIYAVKFKFSSGHPGHCGDLFILQSDTLNGEPAMLMRNKSGKIARCDFG